MAGGAVQRRVGPEQREAVLVLVDLLHGDLPALHAVTLLTICAELALMECRRGSRRIAYPRL